MTDTDLLLFRDHERPLPERVDDLIGRLTVAEKIALLHQYQPPIDRLDVGGFVTGTEALHGVARGGPATVFPQAVGLASTWNPRLVEAVGGATGAEVRGLWHKGTAGIGLNVWAPVVNPAARPPATCRRGSCTSTSYPPSARRSSRARRSRSWRRTTWSTAGPRT